MISREDITGVILAGGMGRRMGGVDKGLQPFRGQPMIAHVYLRFAPQVGELMINANQNLAAYESWGVPVVVDAVGGFAGPLAGFQSGLEAARTSFLATVPCDSPFLPADLVARLALGLESASADIAVARTGGQAHPVFALMRCDVLSHLTAYLASGGRKIDAWYATLKVSEVPFDDQPQAFENINTLDELRRFET